MTVIHSIVPADQIFPAEPPRIELVNLNGSFLEGTRGKDGIQITRVISTDPAMYLNEKYAPGQSYRG